jgi:ankyrin repeat protein
VHQVDVFGQSPMFVAARDGKADIIALLLARGVDVNAPVQAGRGPLYHAASNGRVEAVRVLIAKGASVNAIDGYGQTPLLTAATQLANEKLNVREPKIWRDRQQRDPQGSAAVVEALLLAGADVYYSKGREHYNALHFLREVDIPRISALLPSPASSKSRRSFWSALFRRP